MSDYETTQKRRNIAVGVFVLIGICSIVWLVFKFGDLPVFVSEWKSFEVKVQFPTASGVAKNTDVRFCGYQIGSVTDVEPPKILKEVNSDRFYHQTVVVLSIDKKYNNIPKDVKVKLMSRGLGSSYIEFKALPSDSNQPGVEFLKDSSLLQGSTGMTSEFFPAESQEKLDQLVEGLSTFMNNANDLIGDKANKENFKTTLANLAEASRQATQTLKEFQEFSAAGTATLKNIDVRIEKVVAATLDTSEELSKTAAHLRVILEKVNNGEGSAGKFINDGRLYENLLENTQQLQVLLEELTSFKAEFLEKLDKGLKIKLK